MKNLILFLLTTLFFSSCKPVARHEITIMNFDGRDPFVDENSYFTFIDSLGKPTHLSFTPNYKVVMNEEEANQLETILSIQHPELDFVDSLACEPVYNDVVLVKNLKTNKTQQYHICFICGYLYAYPEIKGLGDLQQPYKYKLLKDFFKELDKKQGHKRDWSIYL